MKNPIDAVKAYLKKVFSDVHNVIVGIVLMAFLGGGSIYLSFRNLWTLSKNIAQSPTPLWATITLSSICCLYTYVKSSKIPTTLNREGQPANEPPPFKIKYLTTGPYKWKVTVFNDGEFDLDECPICTAHDLKFIFGNQSKYCPNLDCNNRLSQYDEFKVRETVKSLIERNIRNGTWDEV